jgi:Immunoglobulin-like domain of bacterial spore germination
MRPIRPLLATTTAVVVAAGVALAGCGRAGPSGGAAGPTPTTTAIATGTSAAGTAGPGAKPGPEAAVAAARDFLQREVGMGELVAGRFQATGSDTGQVAFRLRFGEGGSPMPATAPRTVVRLQRYRDGWAVLGTSSKNIQVSAPVRFARVSSPVAVAGKASAFEGTVQVAVTEDRAGKDRTLGQGVVTGSGTAELGPFSGPIGFGKPTSGAGWLLFTTESEADGVGILEATAVRIRFQVE